MKLGRGWSEDKGGMLSKHTSEEKRKIERETQVRKRPFFFSYKERREGEKWWEKAFGRCWERVFEAGFLDIFLVVCAFCTTIVALVSMSGSHWYCNARISLVPIPTNYQFSYMPLLVQDLVRRVWYWTQSHAPPDFDRESYFFVGLLICILSLSNCPDTHFFQLTTVWVTPMTTTVRPCQRCNSYHKQEENYTSVNSSLKTVSVYFFHYFF